MDAFRYLIVVLSMVFMTLLIANTALFNFTVICMEPLDTVGVVGNRTHRFSTYEEGWILSMVSIGAFTGMYPAIFITNVIGLRQSFTIFGIMSAISTLLVPIASSSFYWVMVTRFIQVSWSFAVEGFSLALAHLACGAVPVSWGGANARGLFVSIMCTSYQLGPFMAMWNAGYFCTSPYGWQSVYYLYGILTFLVATLFFVIYSNSPEKNRHVSINKAVPLPTKKHVVPYARMAKSRSVWGILASGLASSIAYDTFILYGPICLNTALKLEIPQTGLLASLPYLISMFSKILAGIYLDKVRCASEHVRCLSFTAVFQLAMASTFIAMTLISAEITFIPVALFTITMVFSCIYHVGLMNASQVVAQQYTHILTSVLAAQNCLGGFVLPPIIAFFVPHYSKSEWSTVFYGIATLLFITTIIFVMLTKVKPASWTKSELKKDGTNNKEQVTLSSV
uniref:MFS domain-containing protein n=1 Tax=Steinernema glaseri TaxID=37863 RepID=A0A1I7YXN6_9BILA